MRIAQIVPSLEEQHGGPSKSVHRLAAALAALGHDVDLLATRPDGAAEPAQAGRLRVLQFRRDRPEVLCPSAALREHLQRQTYDCLHHHSLWLRTLHYARRAAQAGGAPLVISPRGMLSDWAWQHHRWKKALASRLVHPGAMTYARGWHATSAAEVDDIRRRGFQQPVCVAANGVEAPSAEDSDPRPRCLGATLPRRDDAARGPVLFPVSPQETAARTPRPLAGHGARGLAAPGRRHSAGIHGD